MRSYKVISLLTENENNVNLPLDEIFFTKNKFAITLDLLKIHLETIIFK